MSKTINDYFKNHDNTGKFPWSLYHKPIENSLKKFLEKTNTPESRVLVIGCGLVNELNILPKKYHYTFADIDERIIEYWENNIYVKNIYNIKPQLIEKNKELMEIGEEFDIIYMKEVIEHIVDYKSYLSNLKQLLKKGGSLWLSTPNYGEPLLPIIENTILEYIARKNGFSRKDIHPSKLSKAKLNNAITMAGYKSINHSVTWNRLAITLNCKK